MFSCRLVVIFGLILVNMMSVKASEYYQTTITAVAVDGSTVGSISLNTYWEVDSNVVTGVFSSSTDYNNRVNNKIIAGGSSDNQFVYTAGPPYSITFNGITFTYGANTYTLYQTGAGGGLALIDQTGQNYALGQFSISTISPPTISYYEAIITTSTDSGNTVVIDVYLSVVANIVTGAYQLLSDFNLQTNNQIILPAGGYGQIGFYDNDNIFAYTAAYNGIDGNGISFIYQGTKTNVYQSGGSFYTYFDGASNGHIAYVDISLIISLPATARPTATPTPIPTATPTDTPTATPPPSYYQVTIETSDAYGGPISIPTYWTFLATRLTATSSVLVHFIMIIYLTCQPYHLTMA